MIKNLNGFLQEVVQIRQMKTYTATLTDIFSYTFDFCRVKMLGDVTTIYFIISVLIMGTSCSPGNDNKLERG